MRQRQVEVAAQAGTDAALVIIAGEERIVAARVGMNRHGQHIGAGVEHLLGAVAVVRVEVEDRHARVPAAQALGGDRGVVQVTEPRRAIAPRVMSRRTAQCIHGVGARHRISRGDGGVARLPYRDPRVRAERHGQIAEVPACGGDDVIGRTLGPRPILRTSAPVWKRVGPDFRAARRELLPAIPRGLEVAQKPGSVNGQPRLVILLRRRFRRDAQLAERAQQSLGAGRHVGRRRNPARPHELLRMVQRLIGVIERAHRRTLV